MFLLALQDPASGWKAHGFYSKIAHGHRASPRTAIDMKLSGKQSDIDHPPDKSRRRLLMALPSLFLLPLSSNAKSEPLGSLQYSKPAEEAIKDMEDAIKSFKATKVAPPTGEPGFLDKLLGKEPVEVDRSAKLFQNATFLEKTVEGDLTVLPVQFDDEFTGYPEYVDFTFRNGVCDVSARRSVEFADTGYDTIRFNKLLNLLTAEKGWRASPTGT